VADELDGEAELADEAAGLDAEVALDVAAP